MGRIKKIIKDLIHRYCSKRLCLPKETIIDSTKNVRNLSCGHFCAIGTEGSRIMNVFVGDFSYTSKNSFLFGLKIGKFSCIASGVAVAAGEHPTRKFVSVHPAFYSVLMQRGYRFADKQKFEEYKYADGKYNFVIGNDVWIGSNVLLVEGHSIADGAIIAAGSVVTKDVPPYEVWGGESSTFY